MKFEKIDNKIKITDKNGVEKEYEIVAYINNENGNYLVYTDGKALENENIALYVNLLSEENGQITLEEVENDELMLVINSLKERLVSNE